jgi:hypothetical protein
MKYFFNKKYIKLIAQMERHLISTLKNQYILIPILIHYMKTKNDMA